MTKQRFFIYSTVFLIMGLSNSVIPVLPEIATASSVESGTIKYTLLFSGYFIGALLTLIPFGFLADRYEHLKIIIFAISLTAISGTILTVTNNIHIMILARILEGSACGAFFPAAYAMLAEYQKKNQYLGEFNFLLNAGLAAGAVAAGFLAEEFIKGAIILFTLLSLIVFIFGIIKTSSLQNKNKNNNNDKNNLILKTKEKTHSNTTFLIEIKKILNIAFNPLFIRTWIIAFFIFGITGVMLAYYPQYSSGMLSKPELGIVIATVYISSMTTNLIAGRSSIKFRKMINIGIILAAAGVIISITQPLPGFTLLGIGSGMAMIGLPIAVSCMNISKKDKGLSMGIFTTFTYMGLAFLPMIMGYFTKYGYLAMFAGTSLLMVLTLLLKDSSKNNTS
ncbi:arabinose efflux permease family protein [Methanolobus tindarius DSM 2278]|uniref:Arabinose efflux permease family protein n=1 Tax=Methanolobus tindarius DSM 2278 TaxID=1090322 RepID=W9DUJ3_METTI|nr:MFS transporter [Methanolobus tindarius]ETA69473.1 arabinose efflux permease family protein [Methanolobus tindarius DSM 2278]